MRGVPFGWSWSGCPAHLSWELTCWFTLQDASFPLAFTLSGHPGLTNSRFGFAMAAVGDINQDKFTDVAIGAPLEGFEAGDGASYGSVYIYNGHSDGLHPNPSQVTHRLSPASSLGASNLPQTE